MKFAKFIILLKKKTISYKVRLKMTSRWNDDIRAFGTRLMSKVKGITYISSQ